ncbi:hypothetical protein D3C86_1531800 [compost metagenome]
MPELSLIQETTREVDLLAPARRTGPCEVLFRQVGTELHQFLLPGHNRLKELGEGLLNHRGYVASPTSRFVLVNGPDHGMHRIHDVCFTWFNQVMVVFAFTPRTSLTTHRWGRITNHGVIDVLFDGTTIGIVGMVLPAPFDTFEAEASILQIVVDADVTGLIPHLGVTPTTA